MRTPLVSALTAALLLIGGGRAFAQTNKTWDPGTVPPAVLVGSNPCSQCYVLQVETLVPATGTVVAGTHPACNPGANTTAIEELATVTKAYINKEASGNAIEIAKKYAYKALRPNVGGWFGNILDANGPRSPYGNCAPLAGSIPASAKLFGIRLGAWDDAAGANGCRPPPGECAIGWSRFDYDPESTSADGGPQVFSSLFVNWSHNRDRVARMFIFYEMPPGKQPIKYV